MALFFFFEDIRHNLALYFLVSTIVLYFGPEWWYPSMSPKHGVPIIQASAGNFSGIKTKSRTLQREIFNYKGIPFAQPPIGDLRFQRTQPIEKPLDGTFDASKFGNICAQYPSKLSTKFSPFKAYLGDEDCLYLNVYVPSIMGLSANPAKFNLPVMVFIHGGGNTIGDATDNYGPANLLDKDVILVTIQYRLGIFGALNLGTDQIAGNQYLWDQRMALQWVQKNIHSFGGDPLKVTLFGESAGSLSVFYHLVSKQSQGLFRAAIAQSGTIYTPGINLAKNRQMKYYHNQIVKSLECHSEGKDLKSTLKCLQLKSIEEIISKTHFFSQCNMYEGVFASPVPWKASQDDDFSDDPFFDKKYLQLFENGETSKVPLMLGINKDEGLMATINVMRLPNMQEFLRKNWESCMVQNVYTKLFEDVNEKDLKMLNMLEKFYFGNKNLGNSNYEEISKNLTNLMGDAIFNFGVDKVIRKLLDEGRKDVYYYQFHHVGSFSLSDIYGRSSWDLVKSIILRLFGFGYSDKLGTCHADDILYIFSSSMPFKLITDEEMIDLFVELWTNFATNLNPNNFKNNEDETKNEVWKNSELDQNGNPTYAILKDGKIDAKEKNLEQESRNAFLRSVKFVNY